MFGDYFGDEYEDKKNKKLIIKMDSPAYFMSKDAKRKKARKEWLDSHYLSPTPIFPIGGGSHAWKDSECFDLPISNSSLSRMAIPGKSFLPPDAFDLEKFTRNNKKK